jgi:regulatory protein YycI of two-component signal transduction system YycFG
MNLDDITNYIFIIAFLVIAVFAIISLSPLIIKKIKSSSKKPYQYGEKKPVKILKVEDMNMDQEVRQQTYPCIKITVETMPGKQAFFAMLFPRDEIPKIGDSIDIQFDPKNPTLAAPSRLVVY